MNFLIGVIAVNQFHFSDPVRRSPVTKVLGCYVPWCHMNNRAGVTCTFSSLVHYKPFAGAAPPHQRPAVVLKVLPVRDE